MAGSNLIVSALCIVIVGAPMVCSQVDEWHSDGYGVGTEKITRLHFYHHYNSMGEKPTVVTMAEAPTTKDSPTSFGLLGMTDNLLTEGPEPTSKRLGQAQGLIAAAAQDEFTLVMATSFVFKGGEFSGSSLSVLGRNPFMNFMTKIREMPIVGGTGVFRFARGFVMVTTHYENTETHDLIEEYHMTVMHY